MKFLSLLIICLTTCLQAFAASDRITINQVFTTADGRFAVQATGIPPNANQEQSCHTEEWAKRWFGFKVDENSQSLVATLLSAKARGVSVTIGSSGCEGAWHKITSIYSD